MYLCKNHNVAERKWEVWLGTPNKGELLQSFPYEKGDAVGAKNAEECSAAYLTGYQKAQRRLARFV